MMRGIGFLLGVCLTVALFLLVLHGPDRPAADPSATHLATGNTADPSTTSPPAAGPRTAGHAPLDKEAPGDTERADRESVAADEAEPPPEAPAGPGKPWFERPPGNTPAGGDLPDTPVVARHLFWSPFRSEWAARGFATRLTAATAVPVLVVEEGRGKYRVGFDYQDETERLARVAQIETITGLELE